jgi:hypothetical protein
MTDYRALKAEIAAETAATKPNRQPLNQPALATQPYGGRQCQACCRWLPAKHFWRRGRLGHRGQYVKRCKRCITHHQSTRRCRC